MINYRGMRGDVMNQQDFNFIWENLREVDRNELHVQGFNDQNAWKYFSKSEGYIGYLNDEPICAFGVSLRSRAMYFWFIGTDKVQQSKWLTVHSFAKMFIQQYQIEHFGKRAMVCVWEKHTDSLRWLNRLGFRDTNYSYTTKGERLIFMEKV